MEDGQAELAADGFSALIQDEPENAEGWSGLIRALMALGQDDEAAATLAQVPPAIIGHVEIVGAASALALAREGRQAALQLAEFEARLRSDPNDHAARHDLATALNGMDRRHEASEALLEIIRRDRSWNEDGGRRQLLKFFEAWGLDDPATLSARRKLAALLFS